MPIIIEVDDSTISNLHKNEVIRTANGQSDAEVISVQPFIIKVDSVHASNITRLLDYFHAKYSTKNK